MDKSFGLHPRCQKLGPDRNDGCMLRLRSLKRGGGGNVSRRLDMRLEDTKRIKACEAFGGTLQRGLRSIQEKSKGRSRST